MSSWFENVEGAAPIEIFLLSKLFKEDTFPQKIDLGWVVLICKSLLISALIEIFELES